MRTDRENLPARSPLSAVTAPLSDAFRARSHEVESFWAWHELAWERGWTDGLPVAPPTPEKVEALVEACGLPLQHSLGKVAPAGGEATVETIAINAAMAGCWPDLMPLVLAAVDCALDPAFNLNGVQGTTNPCAPLTIVNGPVRVREGFAFAEGAFGGGSRANAALGRAMRLVLWNIGGGKPGLTDMATVGQPGKWCYSIAENEEHSPWPSLAEDRGYSRDEDVVTVFACDAPHAMFVSGDAERILKLIAQSLPRWSVNMFFAAGQMLLVIGPRVADALARYGMTRADFKQFVHDHARFDYAEMVGAGVLDDSDQSMTYWGAFSRPQPAIPQDGERLPMVPTVDDIHVVVAGGTGQWWCAFCPGWGHYGGHAQSRRAKDGA